MTAYSYPGLPHHVTPANILNLITKTYGVTMTELAGPSRLRGLVKARRAAWYLHRQILGTTVVVLGQLFNRDHTTIVQGLIYLKNEMSVDANLKAEILSLQNTLTQDGNETQYTEAGVDQSSRPDPAPGKGGLVLHKADADLEKRNPGPARDPIWSFRLDRGQAPG